MSDQHAATTLTAAAVIAAILMAGAAARRHDGQGRTARTPRPRRDETAVPPYDPAPTVVREAERHVHQHWQRLRAYSDPPD